MYIYVVEVASLFGSAFVCLLLAGIAWNQRGTRGNVYFASTMLSLSVYALTVAFELLSPGLGAKILWSKLQYLGNANLAPLWLLFILAYRSPEFRISPGRAALLWAVPVASIVLVATNERHGLAWPSVELMIGGLTGLAYYGHGPAVWMLAIYSYVLMAASTVVLLDLALRSRQVYRCQAFVLAAAGCLPWLGNVLYMLRLAPFQGFDVAPIFFTISGVLLAWATFRFRLFRLTPVAHAAILSHLNEGLIILDAEGDVLDINPAAERLLGLTRGRIGTPLAEAGPEAALLAAQGAGTAVLQAPAPEGGHAGTRWIEATVNALPRSFRSSACRLVLLRDITDSKRAEDALREESRFRGCMLEAIADGLCVLRYAEGRDFPEVTVWNRRMAEITGCSMEDMNGPDPGAETEGRGRSPEAESLLRLLGELGEVPLRDRECALRRRHGDERVLSISTSTVQNTDGQTHVLAIVSDVTEKKALAEQLLQAQKMESVGRLAGGVAHDFNNMLAAILGCTELALSQIGEEHPASGDLREIEKAARRSAELTQQLLAFGRKQMVSPRVVNVAEVVSAGTKLLSRLVGAQRTLLTRSAEDLWPVRIDPVQIEQILANLVVNARDAIPGSGVIEVDLDNVEYTEEDCRPGSEVRPGGFVRLRVSDTGEGMSDYVMNHLFEPFFTTKGLGKGTGLGLATVYGIVKQNQGFIEVESRPGEGSTFHVYLPRHEEAAQEAERCALVRASTA